jgi:hypothetical protein
VSTADHRRPAPPAGGPEAIEDYLAAVAAGLVGPRRWRSEVIAELRDGLAEAAEAHRRSTGAPGEAAAVAEFGSPRDVLAGFVAIGAGSRARRAAVGLLISGPLAAAVWVAAMATSGIAPWSGGLAGPWRLLPGVGGAVAVAVPAALLAVAMTGRAGSRWATARPRWAPAAAALATSACAVGDVLMLAAVGAWLISTAAPAGWPALATAAGFSGIRCLLAGRASRHCLAARARLP